MTYREEYRRAASFLREQGVEEYATDARLLLLDAAGLTLTGYLMRQEEEMDEPLRQRYRRAVEKRGQRIPLQHITGHQAFMGLEFQTGPEALVPRQDTEILAQEALSFLESRRKDARDMRVLDMCTGSGCIAVSLACLFPGPAYFASDLSHQALALAKRNAAKHQAAVTFWQGDLFERAEGAFDLIVANPPYIPQGEIPGLPQEVKDHDPLLALSGGEDGLDVYRRLIPEAYERLRPGGALLMEIGAAMAREVEHLLGRARFGGIMIRQDLSGLDRVAGAYRGMAKSKAGGRDV